MVMLGANNSYAQLKARNLGDKVNRTSCLILAAKKLPKLQYRKPSSEHHMLRLKTLVSIC